jgi:hypothetical protein
LSKSEARILSYGLTAAHFALLQGILIHLTLLDGKEEGKKDDELDIFL